MGNDVWKGSAMQTVSCFNKQDAARSTGTWTLKWMRGETNSV